MIIRLFQYTADYIKTVRWTFSLSEVRETCGHASRDAIATRTHIKCVRLLREVRRVHRSNSRK